jgi:prepilin-type N-terminal cleavage/methylation domain-containing protein
MEMELMRRRGPSPESGFSLIEVLVAGAILLVIALGLIPIYFRAIQSNVEGFDYSQVSNWAKSRAEEYLRLPFNSPLLTVPGGGNEIEAVEGYSYTEDRWMTEAEQQAADGGGKPLFTRTTTVRQFGITDLTNPLPGDAPPTSVHLKEITVSVEGSKTAVLGGGKAIAVRVFKSE